MTDFCTGLGRTCFDELPGGAMLVAVHRTVEVLEDLETGTGQEGGETGVAGMGVVTELAGHARTSTALEENSALGAGL